MPKRLNGVRVANRHAANLPFPAAEDAERLALKARACIVRLNAFYRTKGQFLGPEAVKQQANIDDIVHMPPHVNVRRTDKMRVDKIVLRQFIVEAHGRLVNGSCLGEGEIRWKTGLLKAQNFLLRAENCPLRPAQRDDLFALRQPVAAEAPDIPALTPFRPCAGRQFVHEIRRPIKIHPAVDGQPELAPLCHRCAADADFLRVLRRNALKDRKRRQRRKRRRAAAQIRGQNDLLFKKPCLHA